jgi:ABC-2 type transport system permease protein
MSQKRGLFGQLAEEIMVAIRIAQKDARIYYLNPPVIMSSFFFPGFMVLAFTVGRPTEPVLLIPALAAITSFFAAGSVGPAVLPLERRARTLERLLDAPISAFSVVLGKTLAGATLGLAVSLVPLLAGMAWLGTQVSQAFLLLLSAALSALAFSAFGIVFSARAEDIPSAMMPVNLVRFPMLFVSGALVPLEKMPGYLQPIAYLMPLTYSVDAMRQSMLGPVELRLLLGDLAAVSLFLALCLGAAIMALRQDMR